MSKPRPSVQRATGPWLLRHHLRPGGLESCPRDRKSSTPTTRLSHLFCFVFVLVIVLVLFLLVINVSMFCVAVF